jgi:hypothetical protein
MVAAACQRTEQAPARDVDCAGVAESLASFEVGNNAPAGQRAAAVAKHKSECERTNVTAAEARCLGGAKDTWAARACLPRMFPATPAPPVNADCVTVGARMRAAVIAEAGSGSATVTQLDKLVPVLQQACSEDRWPAPVVKCIADTKPGDMAAFQACSNQLPQALQARIAERMGLVMQPPSPPAPSPSPAQPAK